MLNIVYVYIFLYVCMMCMVSMVVGSTLDSSYGTDQACNACTQVFILGDFDILQ